MPKQSQPKQAKLRSYRVKQRTPLSGEMGGTQETTATYDYPEDTESRRNARGKRSIGGYSPTRLADKSTANVGLLEAEFILALVLLIMIMFANSTASYSDRIMSLMKRGTLTCVLFFILALVSSVGPTAAKFSKAFGALVVLAILVTAPVGTALTDVDNLIKNDWIGTGETGAGAIPSKGSADSGSKSGGGVGASLANDIAAAGPLGIGIYWAQQIGSNVGSKIDNAIKGILGKL